MLRGVLQQRLRAAAEETGHAAAMNLLLSEARECVYALEDDEAEEDAHAGSRIGGRPDLDDAIPWPSGIRDRTDETFGSASFIAQINLVDIPQIDGLVWLARGLVSIFLKEVCGVPVKMIYQPQSLEKLKRRLAPPDLDEDNNLWAIGDDWGEDVMDAQALKFEVGITLPWQRRGFKKSLRDLCEGKNDWYAFKKILEPEDCLIRIGGYAFDLEYEDNIAEIADTDGNQIRAEQGPLSVLFAINLPKIGDGAGMWIFIREKDLAKGDFTHVRTAGSMGSVA